MSSAPGHDDPVGPDDVAPALDTGTFSVHVVAGDGRMTLALAGELDLAVADALVRLARQSLTRARPSEVRLDLEALEFIDSSGVRALLALLQLVTDHRAALSLARPQPAVLRVLEITALLDHFRIE